MANHEVQVESIEELLGFDEAEALSKQCYIDDDYVVLDEGRYQIRVNRCATPEAILGWVYHLGEKTWVTAPILRRFVALTTRLGITGSTSTRPLRRVTNR